VKPASIISEGTAAIKQQTWENDSFRKALDVSETQDYTMKVVLFNLWQKNNHQTEIYCNTCVQITLKVLFMD
jgi:hypothetical protein